MTRHAITPHLANMVEAIERVRDVLSDQTSDAFAADWRAQWLVQRGVEIISEARRRLPDDLKARRPEIPWRKVADIGNVLRHDYGSVSAPIMWKLVQEDLAPLETACRAELDVIGSAGDQA